MRGPSGVPRGRGHPPKAASSAAEPGWPLTREPSVGVVFDAYPGFRKGARRRLQPPQGGRRGPRPSQGRRGWPRPRKGTRQTGPRDLLAGRERGRPSPKGSTRKGRPARVRLDGRSLEGRSWTRHPDGAEEGNLRRTGRGSGDPRLCSRAVLIAEVDERRRVRAFGYGSSPYASRTGGQLPGAVLPRAEGRLASAKG